MQGKILDFDTTSRTGVISGSDGNRYTFEIAQWKSANMPQAGNSVDYSVAGGAAEGIYALKSTSIIASKRIGAALFAFFLGVFGAHKFYLGYTKQGIIMLLVFLFGFILLGIPSIVIGLIALIEAILYLTKSDEEFQAIYVDGRKGWF